jgi:hypothetical protein
MQIEYTTPSKEDIEVCVTLPGGEHAPYAHCLYLPQPIVGLRLVTVGKFRATGNSGRVEEATVQFDLRKGEFVIQPKKLVAGGFDFDKPAQPEPATETAPTAETAPAVTTAQTPVVTPNKK